MSKKILSDDELLKIINGDDSNDDDTALTPVQEFIDYFELDHGKTSFKLQGLFQIFRKWRKTLLPYQAFRYEFSLRFPILSANNQDFIKISSGKKILPRWLKSLNPPKRSYVRFSRHYTEFLKKFKLESGSKYITVDNLYAVYVWSRRVQKKRPAISYREFRDFVTVDFNIKSKETKEDTVLWVGISEASFDYIKEKYQNAKRTVEISGFEPFIQPKEPN